MSRKQSQQVRRRVSSRASITDVIEMKEGLLHSDPQKRNLDPTESKMRRLSRRHMLMWPSPKTFPKFNMNRFPVGKSAE